MKERMKDSKKESREDVKQRNGGIKSPYFGLMHMCF